MEFIIGLIVLVLLTSFMSNIYLSPRQVNKRLFNRAPLTPRVASADKVRVGAVFGLNRNRV